MTMESNDEKDLKDDAPETEDQAPGNGADSNASAAEPVAQIKPEQETAERRLLYMAAEFENTKKRLLRDSENSVKFANEKIIRDLLPIVSLFDRALTAAEVVKKNPETKPDVQNFILGVEMTHRELTLTLERFGVEWIGKKGEKFNPERHEAITQIEAPDAEPDSVVQVLDRGCLLSGRLIQPAKVVVAKAKQEA